MVSRKNKDRQYQEKERSQIKQRYYPVYFVKIIYIIQAAISHLLKRLLKRTYWSKFIYIYVLSINGIDYSFKTIYLMNAPFNITFV